MRKLVRQAVLIAARDELGLSTRDEVLDDVPPEKAGPEAVELATSIRPAGTRAVIRRGEPGKAEALVKLDLGPGPNRVDYPVGSPRWPSGTPGPSFPRS